MFSYYFSIQYKRLTRLISEWGLHPLIGIIIMAIGFIGFSVFVFIKTDYAEWIYLFLAMMTLLKLSAKGRNDHLNQIYDNIDYKKIRLIENLVLVFPFIIFLFINACYIQSLLLLLISVVLSLIKSSTVIHSTIPTPFYKYPFEFIMGFRGTILMIPISYFILYQGIKVDNFNLALFSLAIPVLAALSFYGKPEHPHFVMIYNCTIKQFLMRKIGISVLCLLILILPNLALLFWFFWTKALFIFLSYFVACLFITTMILAKYSAYPKEMNLPQALLLGLSLWFPPMLLVVIPIFYKQSIRQLKPIIE